MRAEANRYQVNGCRAQGFINLGHDRAGSGDVRNSKTNIIGVSDINHGDGLSTLIKIMMMTLINLHDLQINI